MSYDIYKQQLLNVPLTPEHCVNVSNVYICYCYINTNYTERQFLEFKLFKNKDNKLTFETFPAKVTKTIDIQTFIIQHKGQHKSDDIIGYIIYKEAIYCFIKFETLRLPVYRMIDNTATVLSDEIINKRHYFNIQIDDLVYRFFLKNQHCLYLKTNNGKQLLLPKSYYYGDTLMKKDYLLQFGIPKQSFLGIFGSYYYVSSFKDAIINAGWSPSSEPLVVNNIPITGGNDGKYLQGAIYRCILFIEHVESKLSDTNDESSTTQMLIAQSNEYAIKNKHISDRGAKWTNLYDTIYSGIHENMPSNMIAHKFPVFIDNYVELNMQSLPMKKTDKYTSVEII